MYLLWCQIMCQIMLLLSRVVTQTEYKYMVVDSYPSNGVLAVKRLHDTCTVNVSPATNVAAVNVMTVLL